MADNTQVFVDNLNRVLQTGASNVDAALKSLAAALKQGVGPAKTGGNTVEKLDELIESRKQRDEKLDDFLKKDFPQKIYDQFKKGMDDLTSEVAECKKSLKDIAKGSSGGGSAKACDCQSALEAIKASVDTVYGVMTKGVSLDSKIVGIFEVIKKGILKLASGRGSARASNTSGGGKGGGGPPNTMPGASGPGAVVAASLGQKEANNVNKTLEESSRHAINLRWNISKLSDEYGAYIAEQEKNDNENYLVLEKNYDKMEDILYSVSSYKNLGAKNRRILNEQVMELMKQVRLHRETGNNIDGINKAEEELLKTAKKIRKEYDGWLASLQAVGGSVMDMTNTAFNKFRDKTLGGLVNDLNEWEIESTRMAANMTSAIHDAGGESKQLVEQYRNLLKVESDVIRLTHQFPAVVRKQWLTAIKKGTRNLEQTREVVNSALAGAWQVGANAEATADEFQKWNMNIGMSTRGATSLARTMTTVSKVTGVMGDNLLNAVSAAREVAQLMRDTGIYSQQVANSVVGWMASAQKFGIDKQVQNIFTASQGGLEAFTQASAETRNLLAASGQIQNILKGNADPEKVMGGVGDALRKMIPSKAFQKDAKGKPIGLPDLKKLSKAEISRIDLVMKRRFGMKLGEATRLLESIQDQNPEDKLAQIEKDLQNPRITDAEKQALELQKKQLEIARDEKKLSSIMDGMAEMADAAKSQDAKFADMLKAGKMTEASFRQGITDSAKLLSQKMERQGKKFEDAMGMSAEDFKVKMTGLIEGMKAGDTESIRQFRELQQKMAEGNKMADSMAKNDSNALDKQENHQQIVQNALQNASKGIHTIITQLNVWIFHAVAMLGAFWAIYRLWSNGKVSENIQGTFDTLMKTIGTKGSGWVHDPYVEKFVKNIDKNIATMSGGKATKARKDETDPRIKAATEELGALGKAAGFVKEKLGGFWDSLTTGLSGLFGEGSPSSIGEGFKKVFGETGEKIKEGFGKVFGGGAKAAGAAVPPPLPPGLQKKAVLEQKKTILRGKKQDKIIDQQKTLLSKQTKLGSPKTDIPKVPKMSPKMDQADGLLKDGAMKLAAVGAGILLLGAVLIGLTVALMKLTGFGAKEAKDVAWVMGVIIGGGAGTLLAAAASAKVMQWASKAIQKKDIASIYKGGLMLMLILPALIILGIALIALGKLLSYVISPQQAVEQAKAVASILLAVGLVAGAVLLSSAFLTGLGLLLKQLPIILPLMALGAVALLVLTPILTALAIAVIYLGNAVLSLFGVDPNWASQTSQSIASILWSTALIAGAILLASTILTALAALIVVYPIIIALMVLGGIAIALLTPAVIFIAETIINLANAMSSSFDLAKAETTATQVMNILWAAFKIAVMVVAATAFLTALGFLAFWAKKLVGMMILGAIAIAILTPAVLSIAKSIINLASSFASEVDVKKSQETAQATSNVLESAFNIAKAIIEARDKITSLVVLSFFAGWFAPSLEDGANALLALADSMFTLTKAILAMSAAFVKQVDPKRAASIAKGVSAIMESVATVSKSMMEVQKYAFALSWLKKWGFSFAPKIDEGAEAVITLKEPLKHFSDAILAVSKGAVEGVNIKEVNKTVSIMKAVGDATAAVGQMMQTMGEKIFPYARGVFLGMGPSIAELMDKALPGLLKFFHSIFNTLKEGLIKPMIENLEKDIKTKDLQKVTRNLQAMASTIESIGKIMNVLGTKILSFGADLPFFGTSAIEIMKKSLDTFIKFFGSMSEMLIKGVISPIAKDLPTKEEFKDIGKRLEGVFKVLDAIPKFLEDLTGKIGEMSGLVEKHADLSRVTRNFSSWFYGIAGGLRDGVINPLMSFPKPEEVQKAVASISAVVEALYGLAEVMSEMSSVMSEIASIGIDFSALEQIGGIFKSGKLELKVVARGDSSDEEGLWRDRMLGVFTGIRSPTMSGGGGIVRGLRQGFGQAIEKPMDEAAKETGKVNVGMNKLSGGFNKFATNQGGAVEKLENLKVTLSADIKDLTNAVKSQGKDGSGGSLAKVEGHLKALVDSVEKIATKIEEVKPTTNRGDLDAQVQARVEQSRPSAQMQAVTDYLAEIAVNTGSTAEELMAANETLEEIKELLQEARTAAGGAPRAPKKKSSPNYYGWEFGRFRDSSAKQGT